MPERADIAEVLGGLVRSGCKDALLELEEKTCQVLELRAHTASVSISPADVTQAGEWKQERGLARRWAKVVGAAVGLGAMALLLALGLPRQEAAPRVPPPVSPGRASPSVSPASAKLAALAPVAPAPESPVRSPPVAPSSGLRARTTPRSPAEPTRPKGGLGYLTVDAVPWAVVFVDGKRLGETPLARRKVPAGDLTLTFVNADLKRTVKREVTVRAGQHATIREDLR